MKIYSRNLYEMQFLLLIVPHCAGGCSMNSTKEWSMPRIQVYKVKKMWFPWSIFFYLSKLQLSHSLQCSSPHHSVYHWHMEDFRYTFLFVRVMPDSLWKRWESPAVPMIATTPGGTQGNVCCISKDVRKGQKAHMSCDSYWYFASTPCSACSSLCGYHWDLPVTVIISRRHMHTSRGTRSAHTILHVLLWASGSSSSARLPAELWAPTFPKKDICLDSLQILAMSTSENRVTEH